MSDNFTSGWDVLDASHEALRKAVSGIPADGWHLPTPCSQWSVTKVFKHAVGDQIGFAATLTGGDGPAFNPFDPPAEPGADPSAELEDALTRAAKAWAAVDRDAAEVPTPVPPNTMTPWMGSTACALDAAVHAWDIAMATGQPSPLTPELAGPLLEVAKQIVDPLRPWGAYAEALPDDAAGDEVASLLRYLGRDPRWTPAA
ncbi:TIGR03086 family metal-binding protein [Nonomuraea spiralis]|uniref:TIGR03086 family metal-binding protein n=1 Tax=Nonomuraea TaxID=83681 RepID=UPI000F7B7169|nr:TIGR03086 family metal-binding protein [Nonomuraea sp. WAC 01424]RSN05004.1 TIGR03086 family protein [Nonomuraea sp. WAC 01424]